jgi:hypothetical protein
MRSFAALRMTKGGTALARISAAQAASAVLFGWRADKFNDGCLFVAAGREFVRSQTPT